MTARTLAAVASTVVTVLATAAAALAWRLELSGLGRPRDTDPRLTYLALLALAVVVPLAVTVAAYRWAGLTSWLIPAGVTLGSLVLFWAITGFRLG